MAHRVFILPLWIRLWHWTNATLILALTLSGLSLHYSTPMAAVLPFSLAREVHNVAGVTLCFAYGVFVIGNIVTGNWWQFVPNPHGYVRRCLIQWKFYLWDIFKGAPHPFPVTPEQNFNPLQQVFYWIVMYLVMPALLVTGLLFLYPEWAPDHILGVDGLLPIAMAHYSIGFLIVCFMVMHVYLATTGKTVLSMVRMMISGWHEE
jgi:thiosulfate reductase cytochrome b subunit